MSKKNAGGGQPKLPGMPNLNGKFLRKTRITVSVPVEVDVDEYVPDDESYRYVKGDIVGSGKTPQSAVKSFSKAYKDFKNI